MVNDKLVEYVKTYSGEYTSDQLHDSLLKLGYREGEVVAAINYADQLTRVYEAQPTNSEEIKERSIWERARELLMKK